MDALIFTKYNYVKKIMIKFLLTLFFISPIFIYAQINSVIKGKIVSSSSNLEGIHVMNFSKKAGVVTSAGGYFEIKALIFDTLIFSAVHLEAKQHIVREEDFGKDLLFIKLEPLVNKLEEVTLIQYKNINAVALGIVPANQKTYTPAERKLYTATGGGNRYGLSSSVSLDGILNGISGRTKMLKKEIHVERKELLLEQLKSDFSESYLMDKLNIPKNYINGFLYYVVEKESFMKIYKTNNKTATEFLLSELSVKYLTIIGNNSALNEK
jgi:hypothetical protein